MSSTQQGEASGTSGQSSSDAPKQSRGPGKYEKRHYPKRSRYNKNRSEASASSSNSQAYNGATQNGQTHPESSSSTNDSENVPQWFSAYIESMKEKIVAEVTASISNILKSFMVDEAERRRHTGMYFSLKRRYSELLEELKDERKKNGTEVPSDRAPTRYGYNARTNYYDKSSGENQAGTSDDCKTSESPAENSSQVDDWKVADYDKVAKTVKLSFTAKGERCEINLSATAVWSKATGETVGQHFAEEIKAFDGDDGKKEEKDAAEEEKKEIIDEKKQENVDEETGESKNDAKVESTPADSSPDSDNEVITSPVDEKDVELAINKFTQYMIEKMNEGLSDKNLKKLKARLMKETKARPLTKNDFKILINDFVDRIKGSAKIADNLSDLLGVAVDLSPASLEVDEIIIGVVEERFDGANSHDAVLLLSAIWSERLVPDDFFKKCLERFLKMKSENDIECLCELLGAIGEDVVFWKKYSDVTEDMQKMIQDEEGILDERVAVGINRSLQAVKDSLEDSLD